MPRYEGKCGENEYRCSCCNEIKPNSNMIMREWDIREKGEDICRVGICKTCNTMLYEKGFKDVGSYNPTGPVNEIV